MTWKSLKTFSLFASKTKTAGQVKKKKGKVQTETLILKIPLDTERALARILSCQQADPKPANIMMTPLSDQPII